MRILKWLLTICLLLAVHSLKIESYSATDKERLPYEIQSIEISEEGFVIHGWGMLSSVQHFRDGSDHQFELKLTSDQGEVLVLPGTILANDQTEVMRTMNVRKCGDGEFNRDGEVCYYDYRNVGFQFVIPFELLQTDTAYYASLIVHGLSSGISRETLIYYPTLVPLQTQRDTVIYQAFSDLIDTQLRVAYQSVFERSEPVKENANRTADTFCSPTYGYFVFYEPGTVFTHVYDRIQKGGVTYYKVHTSKTIECVNGRNVSHEGEDHESWIAGNFVDYIGEPLLISAYEINNPPEITILAHPIIYTGEVIHPLDYAIAYDIEDGDLTDQLQIIDGEVMDAPGNYLITFYVEDSKGLYDIKQMLVTVIEPDNYPPLIDASDHTIYQYDDFDYMKDVSAYDYEDGWLNDVISYTGYVDTWVLGEYPVTYYVMDSEGLIDTKTIIVKVIRNPREKIRYIDQDKPFYEEPIPKNWTRKYTYLFDMLKNPKLLAETKFIK
ncbi:immunoglobulin-like domain-containing protein [Dielma fastidiosa]|uniref:Uncharacterized protein DUF5011 n=1 Tax=Dielma fastidiosa TaxID=1034346 RepID=A0A318L569_9FIRM|nr:immunoglobulin-like domain-containing protein [Dielma fastidiosa]PXX76837.1 uncharacterized protein DUF5011 [Dielma fastidiosa]